MNIMWSRNTIRLLRRATLRLSIISGESTDADTSSIRRKAYCNTPSPNGSYRSRILPWIAVAGGTFAATLYFRNHLVPKAYAESAESNETAEELKVPERKDLPTFRLEEVKKHGKDAEQIWVTYQSGVYDITDFVEAHPGGDKILLSAGGAVDPYWNVYDVHKTPLVIEMMEDMRVGNLDPRDIVVEEIRAEDDPYRHDPKRHPALLVNSQRPFNAETPAELLLDASYTPNQLFFVRSHMPVPVIDIKTHRLQVDGLGVKKPIVLSVDDLKRKFQQVSVSATLQCAGNRRVEMAKFKKVQGLAWRGQAIGNAKWTGVRLRDILIAAGVDPNDKRLKHVQCSGADNDGEGHYFGASITFEKAMHEDTIVAYQMNGEDIPRDHGYPIRLIAPGIVGARQVKWLTNIHVSDEESDTQWQRKDYRALPPTIGHNDPHDFELVPSIQEYPVQCAFCRPAVNTKVHRSDEEIEVAGYAWSGGGRGIIQVLVSPDGGNTWQLAELAHPEGQDLDHMWSWTLFKATVKIPKDAKYMDLVCKATDRSYNTQPETAIGIWNVRGLIHNAWHHIRVDIIDD
uniref:sulfite oxidase n=1 Tax=Ascaris lumbricoides TaxID=6252 RepID=A0A0M3I7X2_ASCLU